MRDFLTGLAILLIIVLSTVLVAPYFVDWNGQRGFLEARLSHALGQKVTIGGAIDLKVLPTPYLVLDQVVIGGDEAPVRVGIHHLDLELTVAPLFHGEFDITEARLEEPTIRVALQPDRTLPALPAAPAFQADVRFDRVHVANGTLAISDPQSGRTFTLDHLDLDADAGSFVGPFKVAGATGPGDARTRFRLSTLAPEHGQARTRLIVDENAGHPALDFDGTVDLASAGGQSMRQSLDGTLVVAGHLQQSAGKQIAWRLSGPAKADPDHATLDGGELRLGDDDANLTLQAKADLQLGGTPKLALDLSAKQLDIDRLGGAPGDSGRPPPPKLPDLPALRRLFAAATPPIATQVDLAVANATYGGDTLSNLEAHFGTGAPIASLKLAGEGPGGTDVKIDGKLKPGPGFAGTVDVGADNLPRAVDWARRVAPWVTWSPGSLPVKTIGLAGRITATPEAVDGVGLALTLDRSKLKGIADVALGSDTQPAKITADLTSDALDLDGLPSLGALGSDGTPDLDLRLDAKAVRVSRFGDGALDAGRIRLALAKAGTHLDLRELRADNLGGASFQATGQVDNGRGRIAAHLDAAHLEALAALVRQLAPGTLADAFVARAPVLAPGKLQIDATLTPREDETSGPTTLEARGKLGATTVAAMVTPDAKNARRTTISAHLEAPDGGALLAQVGLPALPMNVIGASHIDLAARGKTSEPLDTKLTASFGATKLDVAGRFDVLSLAPRGTGTLHLQSRDLTPLLQSLAIAFPDMTGQIAADAAGDLDLRNGEAKIANLKGQVGGIATGGGVVYRHPGPDRPALTGTLELDRFRLASLAGLALGPEQPTAANSAWSNQPFAVGLIDPPRGAFTLKVKTLELANGVVATNASVDLGIAPNLVTLSRGKAEVAGGRIDAHVTLRRDGRQATAEGKIGFDDVRVHLPLVDAHLSGKLDFAGGGTSAQALVASLAGSGEATAKAIEVPRADPAALAKILRDVEVDELAVDQGAVTRAYDEAASAPLRLQQRRFGLGLASGTIRFEPKDTDDMAVEPVSSRLGASLDLEKLRITETVAETLNTLPKSWTGARPAVILTWTGPLDRPARSVDVSAFIDTVAGRALARETARIEAYEFDIRERAFFNARLRSERQRETDRQKAEDDARKAEADRKARAEAARQERLRKEQAARAARDQDSPPPDQGRAPSPQEPAPPHGVSPPGTDPSSLGRY